MILSFLFGKEMQAQQQDKILFCYGDFYPSQIKNYDVVVLEGSHFSKTDIEVLKQQNKTVLGYISLGEVNKDAAHYEALKEHTLSKNKLWNSYILDLKNKETYNVLMSLFDEAIHTKGLDGLFLDNIDNYGAYGPTPKNLPLLVHFLKDVKEKYPNIYLLQNAGLDITKNTHSYVNAIAIESVATNYNFTTNNYKLRNKKGFDEQVQQLKDIEANYNLPIILIEYADSKRLRKKVVDRIKTTQWNYFIGSIELQKLPTFK